MYLMTKKPYKQLGMNNKQLNSRLEESDGNIKLWGFDAHPVVTPVSVVLIAIFIAFTLLFQEQAETIFNNVKDGITNTTDWFFILVANIYLGVIVFLGFGKFGNIRLGGADAKPEFSTFAWFAMLFSAGMGIGLLFYSVAEPIYHFQSPSPFWPNLEPETVAAAKAAMGVTFFHWGLHPWGIYALVGLSLAFATFNQGLPLSMRSVFYPLLGKRIYGWPGNLIDILALLATLFGLATSLGFGAQQINSGLNFLFGLPNATWLQVLLIAIITSFATLSVVSGLDRGVRFLSEINIYIAACLMGFLFLVGPTLFFFSSFVDNVGYYISILPAMSFWVEIFEETDWQDNWTIVYWSWWIAWSPFVGIFIARVSKGRTVREFVMGVLFIPSLLCFFWMTVFGGSALKLTLDGVGNIPEAVQENVATALFVMLQELPFSLLSAFVGIVLVITFFVTSSDSGSLVVDSLASGGKLDSPVIQRVFWAIAEGVVAAVLLLGGGVTALQTAVIATGLPFAIVLLVMCFSLYRSLAGELTMLEAAKLEAKEISHRDTEVR